MAGRSVEIARLFATVEAETKGLDNQLAQAERSFGRTADFIKAHPVAAAGALGAALIGVGIKATEMAAEVDTAVRKLGANLPDAVGRFDDLKQVAADLSVQFGVAQTDIVASMQAIAKGGVDSTDDLIAATRAVQLAVKATGEETGTVVELLDKTLDAFGLSAKDSEAVLAKLFVTAQGKTSLSELAGVFDRLAPILAASGIGFDTAAKAASVLIGEGKNAKAIVKELTDTLNTGGTPAVEALAARAKDAGDGLKQMKAQADLNNTSVESLAKRQKEQLNAALIDFGETILPAATFALQGFINLLGALGSAIDKINTNSAAASIASLGGALHGLVGTSLTDAFARLDDALDQVVTRRFGQLSLITKTLGNQDLPRLVSGLQEALVSGQLTADQFDRYSKILGLVNAEIAKRGIKDLVEDTHAAGAAAGLATTAVGTLTAAQLLAVTSSKDLSDEQKAGILTTKALTDEQQKLVNTAVKELAKASKEAAKELKALRDQVAATFASATTTLIDDTAEAIRHFEEEAKKVDLPEAEVKAFVVQLQAQGKALESVRLSAGLANAALSDKDPELALRQVTDALEETRDVLEELPPGTEAYNTTLDRANELLDAQQKLQKGIKDEVLKQIERERQLEALARGETVLLDGKIVRMDQVTGIISEQGVALDGVVDKTKTHNQKVQETIQKVGTVAQGVLGIATAFGIVNDKAAAVLGNVINIGTNIEKALGGDPSAIVGVIGSLTGILGSIFGGASPEEKARRALIQSNVDALRENTATLLSTTSSGFVVAGARKGLTDLFAQIAEETGGKGVKPGATVPATVLAGILQKFGITLTDLEQLFKDSGLSGQLRKADGRFDVDLLGQLFEFLKQDFTKFGDTFAEQMERIRISIEAGLIKPADEFDAVVKGLSKIRGGAPSAITKALKAGDITTPGGRDAIAKAFRDLIANIEDLTDEQLGGLNASQFLSVVQRLLKILESDQPIGPVKGPTAINPPPPDFSEPGPASKEQADTLNRIAKESRAVSADQRQLIADALKRGLLTAPEAAELIDGLKQAIKDGVIDAAESAALFDPLTAKIKAAPATDVQADALKKLLKDKGFSDEQRDTVADVLKRGLLSGGEATDLIAAITKALEDGQLTEDELAALFDPLIEKLSKPAPAPDLAVGSLAAEFATAIGEPLEVGFADLVSIGDETNALLAEILANTSAFVRIAPPHLPVSSVGPGTATSPGTTVVTFTGAINLTVTAAPGDDPQTIAAQVDQAFSRFRAQLTRDLQLARAGQGTQIL